MSCSNGVCSLNHSHSPVLTKTIKTRKPSYSTRPVPKTRTVIKHEKNCGICNEHKKLDKQGTPHLHKHLHREDHACQDHTCPDHGTPHGHIKNHDNSHEHNHDHTCNHEHKHDHTCNHDHSHDQGHEHEDHNQPRTLESIIGHSKLPQWLKELTLNVSFLSPALIISKLLSHTKLPQIVRTFAAITGMHALNRGKTKLGRLGLTYLISGAAAGDKALAKSTDNKIGLGANWARFIATTCVAIIEKFGGNGHDGGHNFKEEIKTFRQNVRDINKWKELWPSLVNVESKVQIITPLINSLIKKISPEQDSLFNTVMQIVLTSSSFVGFDQILRSCASIFGKGSAFASMAGTVCGCCSSPVCAAAATDSALANTF